MRVFIALVPFLLFLSGCSLKEVYEPKEVVAEWEKSISLDETIEDKTADVALLENNTVVTYDKEYDIDIQKGFRILGKSGGYILTTDIDGNLVFHKIDADEEDLEAQKELHLKKTIAAASTDGNVVAVVFANGKLALYNLEKQEPLFSMEAQSSIALDAQIVNPYFMNDLVLFLTLDGKVVIVNKTLKKKLRTIIVSSEEYFNNVIYFSLFQDKLIVATATKLLSFGAKQVRRDMEIREVVHDDENLYVATKQGDIFALDSNLKTIAKVHFPFAHFLGLMIVNDTLYALEKEGYLIELSKDLLTYKVYEVDFDDEADVFVTKEGFIVGDEKIVIDANDDSK